MFQLHPTEKLRTHLGIAKAAVLAGPPLQRDPQPNGVDALLAWYGNVFTVEEGTCFLTTNAASLYSVVFPAIGIRSDRDYLHRLRLALEESLSGDGLAVLFDEIIGPGLDKVVFAKTASKPVLGSMKQMALECQVTSTINGIPVSRFGPQINGCLYNLIRPDTPREALERIWTGCRLAKRR